MKSKIKYTDEPMGKLKVLNDFLPPVHPGEFLKEILDELGISQAGFARALGLSPMRISHIAKGKRPVTAEMALLFGKAFSQSPQYWINLQAAYDLKTAEKVIRRRLVGISELVHVPASNAFFEKYGKIHKDTKNIKPKTMEKEVAEAIKSFRGKLKWSDNLD
jgi:addiction module HigA family antidote